MRAGRSTSLAGERSSSAVRAISGNFVSEKFSRFQRSRTVRPISSKNASIRPLYHASGASRHRLAGDIALADIETEMLASDRIYRRSNNKLDVTTNSVKLSVRQLEANEAMGNALWGFVIATVICSGSDRRFTPGVVDGSLGAFS